MIFSSHFLQSKGSEISSQILQTTLNQGIFFNRFQGRISKGIIKMKSVFKIFSEKKTNKKSYQTLFPKKTN